jgi:hypothetical protein
MSRRTRTDADEARQWAKDFHAEVVNALPPQIRHNIDWDLVAADLLAEWGRDSSTTDTCQTNAERSSQTQKAATCQQASVHSERPVVVQVAATSHYYPFEVRDALGTVLNQYYNDEERDYEGCSETARRRHVFNSLRLLGEWLTYINQRICI